MKSGCRKLVPHQKDCALGATKSMELESTVEDKIILCTRTVSMPHTRRRFHTQWSFVAVLEMLYCDCAELPINLFSTDCYDGAEEDVTGREVEWMTFAC